MGESTKYLRKCEKAVLIEPPLFGRLNIGDLAENYTRIVITPNLKSFRLH